MIKILTAYAISIISVFSFLLCYKKITNNKYEFTLKMMIMLLVGSLISVFLLYINNSFIKNCFTIFFLSLFFNKMSEIKGLEPLYYAIIIWIYALFFDLLIMLIVSLTGVINLLNIIYVQTIFTFLMAILLYCFCSIPFIRKFTNMTITKLSKLRPYLILDLVFIFILIYISMLCFKNIDSSSEISFYITFALFIFFVIYITLDKHYNIKRIKELNRILIKNNEFFMNIEENNRILKHNLIHQLLGVKSVSGKKAKELIDELILDYNQNYNIPKDIKKIPEGINGLIYEKFYSFNDNEINLVIDNNINSQLLDNLRPKTFNELCEALGVLIDNALEASVKSSEKVILINFYEDKENYYININNTFGNILDIDEFGNKNYSTKKGLRGIGVFSILKRKEIKLKTKIINNCFITDLKVKKTLFN